MQWMLEKKFSFEASHQLVHHDGKCANLHGHSWKGSFRVMGYAMIESGPKRNMLIDYSDLGKIAQAIEDTYDHKHLNDVLNNDMPTSEILSFTIFTFIQQQLAGKGCTLVDVSISETDGTKCSVGAS